MAEKVGIIGVAQSDFSSEPVLSLNELIFSTTREALADAGIGIDQVDGVVISSNDQVDGRPISIMVTSGSVGAYGKDLVDVPSSGEHALVLGCMRLLTGGFKTQLVATWSSLEADDLRTVQNVTCEPFYQRQLGIHDQIANALQAGSYLAKNPDSLRAAARLVVKNRGCGPKNPIAHLKEEVSEEEVLSSPYTAWPLHQLMCPPESQGVVALVLTNQEKAKELGKDKVAWINGLGWASDSYWLGERDLSWLTSLEMAAMRAYDMAGIKRPLEEFDVAEIQEVTAYHELMAYEALKFCGPGEGHHLLMEGATGLEGKLPVNPSGGALCANPYFATGMARVAEAALQILGKAGRHQIQGSELAIAQATSGFAGQSNTVFVLSSDPLRGAEEVKA